mgnify:CR=1 FL=1
MQEPKWGYDFLKMLVELWNKHQWIADFYPIGADIFVFVYPIFLTYWYLSGMITKNKLFKQDALIIFFSCLFSVIVNILSQQFFDKQRPIYEFWIQSVDNETLLHSWLPTTSFPSDHAVVTFSIAIATLLIGIKYHKRSLKIWSVFLFIFAILTGICRIGTTVHWTTDIIAGTIVGLLIPIILVLPACYSRLEKWIFEPVIRLEERIISKLFWARKTLG